MCIMNLFIHCFFLDGATVTQPTPVEEKAPPTSAPPTSPVVESPSTPSPTVTGPIPTTPPPVPPIPGTCTVTVYV